MHFVKFMSSKDDSKAAVQIIGARLVLPGGVVEDAALLVDKGRIARIGERLEDVGARDLNLDGLTLYPGFIDVHIHGALGVDVLEATTDDLYAVARFLAASGVTAWLPTLVPAPAEDYRRAVEAIARLMREQDDSPVAAARAVGLHYEGPFVNTQQCGALRTAYFRDFREAAELDALPVLDIEGAAHMITLAPEVEGGIELVSELVRRGWVVSIGHTRAAIEVLRASAQSRSAPYDALPKRDVAAAPTRARPHRLGLAARRRDG